MGTEVTNRKHIVFRRVKQLPSVDTINEYVEKGLINARSADGYTIYNYSKTCEYAQAWDEVTIACRGLILDEFGRIIARPFDKFFNYEQLEKNEVPAGKHWIFEKVDGSLGIAYMKKNGEVRIATRGSMYSDQAVKATEILHSKYPGTVELIKSRPEFTFLFEIIYPANRIIVDYGKEEKLYFLAVIDKESGIELTPDEIKGFGFYDSKWDLEAVPLHEFTFDGSVDFKKVKAELNHLKYAQSEGVVVHFESGKKFKIKLDDYIRVARLLTGITAVSIWKYIIQGDEELDKIEELGLPDEFMEWFKATYAKIKNSIDIHIHLHKEVAKHLRACEEKGQFKNRRHIFEYAKELCKKFNLIESDLMEYYDGKDPERNLKFYNQFRPRGDDPQWLYSASMEL